MDIKTLFETKQAILESKLKILIDHPVCKGDQCESAWIDFFRSFLPSKYAIDRGFVFDKDGSVSEQIDIIIYDALYAPLIFGTESGEKFITAESVYAVFDSKPMIDKANLEYTNKKVQSVVSLRRTSREIINAGKVLPARDITPILGGILAINSVQKHALEKNLNECPYINLGCAIRELSFLAERNDSGDISNFVVSSPEETVLAFFYIMLDELYKIGTVPAIDIRQYASNTLVSMNHFQDKVEE